MRENYVITCDDASDAGGEIRGRKAMEEILALRSRPDAIFCFNGHYFCGRNGEGV